MVMMKRRRKNEKGRESVGARKLGTMYGICTRTFLAVHYVLRVGPLHMVIGVHCVRLVRPLENVAAVQYALLVRPLYKVVTVH
eukprot:30419-Pyramimonas_sp.AAC.1